MKITHDKILVFFASSLLLISNSCNLNTHKKDKEETINRKDAINKNKEDAKLLVFASENYIRLIDYCNFLKDTVVKDDKEEILIVSIATKIANISEDLQKTSSKELVLLPKKSDFNLSYKNYLNSNTPIDIKKNKKKFYKKLNDMMEAQIDVMETIDNKSNNFSLHILAEESKNILVNSHSKIEYLIN